MLFSFGFVLLVAVIMLIIECRAPRQAWPTSRHWKVRALLTILTQLIISFLTGYYLDPSLNRWMGISLDLPLALEVLIGYLAITLIYYGWHRIRHVGLFWDIFHQFHHSPVRLELLTAFYKHPVEVLADGFISSIILYVILGVSPLAGTIVIAITALAELFYHWNIKTPYWLGFIIQRPESHCVHHERGKHHYNYSDLPLWDILFGTFYNPKETQFKCGFSHNKELRLKDILTFQNVNNRVMSENIGSNVIHEK